MVVNIWRTTVTGLLASAALIVVGCGSDRVGGVTAPSATAAPAASAATTTNRVVAFDHGGGDDGDEVDGEAPVTSLVAGTACPSLSFMIGDFKISVTTATRFEGGSCADIKPGAMLEVKGVKTGTSIAASKVEFKGLVPTPAPPGTPTTPPTTPPSTQPIEGEGSVTSITAGSACPTLQFVVSGFTVKLSASTIFERGTCADIKVGVKLEVNGTMDTTTRLVTATKVEFDNDNENENEPAEGEGIVTSLVTGTSCPTLNFMIGTFLVKLDASTVFDKGSCADIQVGSRVHVKGGLNRTTSSVLATRISVQTDTSPGHPIAEGESRVTSVMAGSTCPSLTFKIDDWTVSVDTSTAFNDGACANITVGRRLHVKAIVTGDHTALATRVDFKND